MKYLLFLLLFASTSSFAQERDALDRTVLRQVIFGNNWLYSESIHDKDYASLNAIPDDSNNDLIIFVDRSHILVLDKNGENVLQSCTYQFEIASDFFRLRKMHCNGTEASGHPKFIYGYIKGGKPYVKLSSEEFTLDNDLNSQFSNKNWHLLTKQ